MKIAAIGDAHLGRSAFSIVNQERGVNQRELDFELAFAAAIEAALATEPDLIVWLGDIFDHPRPSFRSYRVAQRGLATIRAHGRRAVVISGNHDTPRLPGMGSPYSALADAFPEMHWAHRLTYEAFDIGGVRVHCVPQMLKVEHTLEALDEADRNRALDHTNLLLTHPRLIQVEPRHADINEIEVDQGALKADLVLLGHYHNSQEVTQGIWYVGSPDSFNFADEPERPKGVATLDTDTGAFAHVEIPPQRPMVTLDTVHAAGLSTAELQSRMVASISAAPANGIARLFLELVDPDAYRLVDGDTVREAGAHALHVKLEPKFISVSNQVHLPELDTMPARWENYVAGQDLEGYDRERVRQLGIDYLSNAVEGAQP